MTYRAPRQTDMLIMRLVGAMSTGNCGHVASVSLPSWRAPSWMS
jgi:hypothetical protein